MKLVVEGTVATLFDDNKAVLKISILHGELVNEVLNTDIITDVEVTQLSDIIDDCDTDLNQE